jgi:hypothetical protein
MSVPTATSTRPYRDGVGDRRELARYRVPAGERVVVGQRVNGVVRISDVPSDGLGRAYLVERELELDGYGALLALVDDYVAYAKRYAEVPMGSSAVRRCLRDLAT